MRPVQLYQRGILQAKMVKVLWDEHDPSVQSRLLGLMLEYSMLVAVDLGMYICLVVELDPRRQGHML